MFAAPTKKKSPPVSKPASPPRPVTPATNQLVQRVSFQLATQPVAALAGGQTSPSAVGASNPSDSNNPAVVRSQLGSGQPLSGSVRSQMERGFGQSFSGVRVHTDSQASRLASSFSARAFTIGSDVAFASGEYRPGTLFGDALIAHELAHTLQQVEPRIEGNANNDLFESNASRSAARALLNIHGEKHGLARPGTLDRPMRGGLGLRRCNWVSSLFSSPDHDVPSQELCAPQGQTPGALRITRDRFLELTRGASVSTAALTSDIATAGANIEQADQNNDHRISEEREWQSVYDLINRHLGRDPGEPLVLRVRSNTTAAGLMLSALGRLGATRLRTEVGSVSLANVITLVGMSDTSIAEARALRRESTPVQLITDIPGRESRVRSPDGAHVYDLNTAAGRRDFVNTMPLPRETRQRVLDVLTNLDAGARREIGELARVWSLAYCGNPIPRRVILSGHGDGTWISGDDHDFFNKNSLLNLGRALPRAADQIYSFHISSCQHGYDSRMRHFRDVFRNLQEIWGYAGSSPSGASAQRHMIVWNQSTRGFPEGGTPLEPSSIAGTTRADVAAVWTRRGDRWQGPQIRPFADLLREATTGESSFQQYFNGQLEIPNPSHGFLYDYYNILQQLTTHPGMDTLPPATQQRWTHLRNQALRLRLYTTVARNFQHFRRDQISAGYRAVGLPVPDFQTLSRRAALQQISAFQQRMRGAPEAAATLWTLLEALRVLDERIPMAWVE